MICDRLFAVLPKRSSEVPPIPFHQVHVCSQVSLQDRCKFSGDKPYCRHYSGNWGNLTSFRYLLPLWRDQRTSQYPTVGFYIFSDKRCNV
ncbi:hypothetical protein CEXT_779031 [Caerostris extrusa]|uniref:Uncharacterized protein n=1 Tax=Caerostris extrusa TaxID=172846 RepID=A0AAV4MMK9_CAEEX|nr:hypothetical protein CEXT_779031 [Caerostris extrusa]